MDLDPKKAIFCAKTKFFDFLRKIETYQPTLKFSKAQ